MKPTTTATPAATSQKILLDRLYSHIATQPITAEASLLGGQMGYALFESYYQRYAPQPLADQEAQDRIWDRVTTCLDAIQSGELIHSFAGGIAGVAWGFLHLANQGLLTDDDLDAQDVVADLDEALFELSMDCLQRGDFDYLHGGLSAVPYLLERTPNPTIDHYLTQIIAQLDRMAVRLPDGGITWPFYNFGKNQPGDSVSYNLGLSHGTASVVALLSLLHERGYARTTCTALIEGCLAWMWRVRNRQGTAVFPNQVTNIPQPQHSRLAWCYGDLGIANSFWLGGEVLHQPLWQGRAVAVVQQAAARRDEADTRIQDTGMCHGSAGAAHLFRLFAKRTQMPDIEQAADYWLNQTLQAALPNTNPRDEQVDVFLQFNGLTKTQGSNLGLLEGEASIGMALLAELGAPTDWNRFLLLS